MATNYRQIFADADRQRAYADALLAKAVQSRAPVAQGRIVPSMGIGEGIAQLGEALLARRAGKQATAGYAQADEERRKAQAAALSGMARPPNSVETREAQSPYGRAQTALEAEVAPGVVQQYLKNEYPDTSGADSTSLAGYRQAKSEGYKGTYTDYKKEFEGRERNIPAALQIWDLYSKL